MPNLLRGRGALTSAEASLFFGEAGGGGRGRKRESAGHDGKRKERREAPASMLLERFSGTWS